MSRHSQRLMASVRDARLYRLNAGEKLTVKPNPEEVEVGMASFPVQRSGMEVPLGLVSAGNSLAG